jgi:cytidylate kinase
MSPSVEAIINRQIQRAQLEARLGRECPGQSVSPRPVITLSRALGSGGTEVARQVAERLHCQVFDREILEKIAEKTEARRELVEAVDEKVRSQIDQWIDGLFRRQLFDETDFYYRLVKVVGTLEELGSVVIVGRGANFIQRRRIGLDVRIIAPIELRIKRLMLLHPWDREQAMKAIQESDQDRGKFIKRLFDKDWEDPQYYDLIVNTEELSPDGAAAIIEAAWLQRLHACPLSENMPPDLR